MEVCPWKVGDLFLKKDGKVVACESIDDSCQNEDVPTFRVGPWNYAFDNLKYPHGLPHRTDEGIEPVVQRSENVQVSGKWLIGNAGMCHYASIRAVSTSVVDLGDGDVWFRTDAITVDGGSVTIGFSRTVEGAREIVEQGACVLAD